MVSNEKNAPQTQPSGVIRAKGFNSRNLIKAIFDSENPEQIVRTIPAQSLYVAIRTHGLESSAELLEITTAEQCRLLIDFDCWSRDSFREDHFWEWLAVTDSTDSLALLQKILRVVDLKLVALMVSRYVDAVSFDEPADQPPGPNYFTPDKGRTWLALKTENKEQVFLMNRLLALLFESNTDLFYQILSIPNVATPSELEEESYQEKQKRMSAEGIPDFQYAAELNSPFDSAQLKAHVAQSAINAPIEDIAAVEPVIYEGSFVEPLRSLVNQLLYDESFELEMTLLLNAAIVHYAIDISEITQVLQIADKVKGALNLGLESALEITERQSIEIYRITGLRGLYRHGLAHLLSLAKEARIAERSKTKDASVEKQLVIEGLLQRFPAMPTWLNEPQAHDPERREARFSAIQHLKDIVALREKLR